MRWIAVVLFLISASIIIFLWTTSLFTVTQSYEHQGNIEPSYVTVENIYSVNNEINDVLTELSNQEFFKIFRVNIGNPWTIWSSTFKCKLNQCPIEEEDRSSNLTHIKIYRVDKHLTEKDIEFTHHIKIDNYSSLEHDEWIFDEHKDNTSMFVNLAKNPERFSGYNGSNIWHELYEGNLSQMNYSKHGPHEEFLFQIISGLQTSINMHISQHYLNKLEVEDAYVDFDDKSFYRNYTIFYNRIGLHPGRIKNLFYLYLFLIHTFDELGFYLPKYTYDTLDTKSNELIQAKMKRLDQLFDLIPSTKPVEDDLFSSISKPEFRSKLKPQFMNITQILDCIGWNICKLNAKIQFTGLAAMLKVILPEKDPVFITENEMVGLLNLFHRVSNSVKWYRENRQSETRYRLFMIFIVWLLFLWSIWLLIVGILILIYGKSTKEEDTIPLKRPTDAPS